MVRCYCQTEFIGPAMCVVVTNFVVAVHFCSDGLVSQQFGVISFNLVGLRNYSSFLFHNKSPES